MFNLKKSLFWDMLLSEILTTAPLKLILMLGVSFTSCVRVVCVAVVYYIYVSIINSDIRSAQTDD